MCPAFLNDAARYAMPMCGEVGFSRTPFAFGIIRNAFILWFILLALIKVSL
jgi:hypothetical protein